MRHTKSFEIRSGYVSIIFDRNHGIKVTSIPASNYQLASFDLGWIIRVIRFAKRIVRIDCLNRDSRIFLIFDNYSFLPKLHSIRYRENEQTSFSFHVRKNVLEQRFEAFPTKEEGVKRREMETRERERKRERD